VTRYQEINETSIRVLVEKFYGEISLHDTLSPVFHQALNSEPDAWTNHINRMCDFWSSIMLMSGKYKGTPLQAHHALPRFDLDLFDEWLVLFCAVAEDTHGQEAAQRFRIKSESIASSLRMGVSLARQREEARLPE